MKQQGLFSKRKRERAVRDTWVKQACDDWETRFGLGTAPGGRIAGGLKRIVKVYGWEGIRPAWQRYLAFENPQFCTPQNFASKLGEWLERRLGPTTGRDVAKGAKDVIGRWIKSSRAVAR